MGINVVQWRCSVGMFNCWCLKTTKDLVNNPSKILFILSELLFVLLHYSECFFSLLTLLYLFTFLKCHGDIEINPGPRKLKLVLFQYVIGTLIAYVLITSQN